MEIIFQIYIWKLFLNLHMEIIFQIYIWKLFFRFTYGNYFSDLHIEIIEDCLTQRISIIWGPD
jgi:hypothetical protein